MRISVLGTGDLIKIPRFTDILEIKLREIITDLGEMITRKGHELVIIPDRGVPTEVATVYREAGGKKVYGVVPTRDKKFGIEHILCSCWNVSRNYEKDNSPKILL